MTNVLFIRYRKSLSLSEETLNRIEAIDPHHHEEHQEVGT